MDSRRASSCAGRFGGDRRDARWARDVCSSRRAVASSHRRESRSRRSTSDASRISCSAGSISIRRRGSTGRRHADASSARCTVSRETRSAGSTTTSPRDSIRTIPTRSRDSSPLASSFGSAVARRRPTSRQTSRRPFVRRGTARAWIASADAPPLGEHARQVLGALQRDGASFFDELRTSSELTSRSLRDALRELVGAGLVDQRHDRVDATRSFAGGRSCRRATARSPIRRVGFRPTSRRRPIDTSCSDVPTCDGFRAGSVPTRKARSRRIGRVAGRSCAHRACSGPRLTRARSAELDCSAMAGALRRRRAGDVAARASDDCVARDLSRAQASRVPRRSASRLLRARTLRCAVRAPRSGRDACDRRRRTMRPPS